MTMFQKLFFRRVVIAKIVESKFQKITSPGPILKLVTFRKSCMFANNIFSVSCKVI